MDAPVTVKSLKIDSSHLPVPQQTHVKPQYVLKHQIHDTMMLIHHHSVSK